MTEEQEKKLKEEYKQEKQEQKAYQNLLKEVKKLEEEEKVKNYLSLLEKMNQFDKGKMMESEERIIERAFYELSRIKETNKIMVYMGTYERNREDDRIHGSCDDRVHRNDSNADYSLYVDLENVYNQKFISIVDREAFEEDHIILGKLDEDDKKYYRLRREFLKDVVRTSQKQAIQKLKTRKERK